MSAVGLDAFFLTNPPYFFMTGGGPRPAADWGALAPLANFWVRWRDGVSGSDSCHGYRAEGQVSTGLWYSARTAAGEYIKRIRN